MTPEELANHRLPAHRHGTAGLRCAASEPTGRRVTPGLPVIIFLSAILVRGFAAEAASGITPKPVEFFEQWIRPPLANQCYECHGAKKQESGLRLDFRDGLLKGGKSGPVLIPGDAQRSPLIRVIKNENVTPQILKDHPKLADPVIANFVAWIDSGAPDPRDSPPTSTIE